MERWEDPQYQECYRKIFEGKWEEYDPWNADYRSDAKTDLYETGSKLGQISLNEKKKKKKEKERKKQS